MSGSCFWARRYLVNLSHLHMLAPIVDLTIFIKKSTSHPPFDQFTSSLEHEAAKPFAIARLLNLTSEKRGTLMSERSLKM